MRYFKDVGWATISNETRKSITEDMVRTKLLANKNRLTTSSASAEKDHDNRVISHIISHEYGFVGLVIRVPSNGIRTQVST